MRVHELAKKYKIDKDELIGLLNQAGFPVKNHMSGVTDDMVAVAEKHAQPATAKIKSKAKTKTAAKTKAKTKTKTVETSKAAVKKTPVKVKSTAKKAAPKA